MPDFDVLHHGAKSRQARLLALALNERLEQRYLSDRKVHVYDGPMTVTDDLLAAAVTCAWVLGAETSTLARMRRENIVPIGVNRMIRSPGLRTQRQRELGQRRVADMRKRRKRRAAEGSGSRQKAMDAMLARVGVSESPPGSNGGGLITLWEAYFGFGRVAWCGIFFGFHVENFGGVDVNSDVASVNAIYEHGRNGRDPYGSFQSSVKGAPVCSAVIIGGPTVHVEALRTPLPDGSALTCGGNTSPDRSGSQANGGIVAARHRSSQEIFGVCTMNFPN